MRNCSKQATSQMAQGASALCIEPFPGGESGDLGGQAGQQAAQRLGPMALQGEEILELGDDLLDDLAVAGGRWAARLHHLALSAAPDVLPEGQEARLALLVELLRKRHALLVLDNLETVLQPGEHAARYRDGYAGYGLLLQRLGETSHQGCVLVTSQGELPELVPLQGARAPVRALRLGRVVCECGPDAPTSFISEISDLSVRGAGQVTGQWSGLVEELSRGSESKLSRNGRGYRKNP
jgi:hypothetical protein